MPGERKSVEPMAARLAPHDVRRRHQSLHHFVADAPWNDQEVLEQVRQQVLPAMQKHGPVVAWIIDEHGISQAWETLGRRRSTVLRRVGKTR